MTKIRMQKRYVLLWAAPCVALLLSLAAPNARAQVLYGSIVGDVKDPTGAAVPRAAVTITSKETNQSRQAATDPSGTYSFPDVQSGTYTVKVVHEGFKAFERADVPVTLNNVTRVDVSLEVGAVTQTVEVKSEAPALAFAWAAPAIQTPIESIRPVRSKGRSRGSICNKTSKGRLTSRWYSREVQTINPNAGAGT